MIEKRLDAREWFNCYNREIKETSFLKYLITKGDLDDFLDVLNDMIDAEKALLELNTDDNAELWRFCAEDARDMKARVNRYYRRYEQYMLDNNLPSESFNYAVGKVKLWQEDFRKLCGVRRDGDK